MNAEIIFQDPDFYSPHTPGESRGNRRGIMSAFLLASDLFSTSLSMLTAIIIWRQLRVDLQLAEHLTIIPPLVFFFISSFSLIGLYPGVGTGPVEELRRVTLGVSCVMLAMIVITFFFRSSIVYSRGTFIISWLLILISVPISRKIFRRLAHRLGYWGIPVVIAGEAEGVERILNRLRRRPLTGFWPVLCVAGEVKDIFEKNITSLALFSRVKTLMYLPDQGKLDSIHYLTTQSEYKFERIILILDEARVGPIWFTPTNIVDHIGLEVAYNLAGSERKFFKRFMELAIIGLSLPVLLALSLVIGFGIKLDSTGPIFFRHKRVGHHGKDIWIWKFRTMFLNSEAALSNHLENDGGHRKEWEQNFKLKADPRITRIGKFLRRSSLDELPQLWNVLKGEMSLIGPRPIIQEESILYGDDFEIYKQITPGITGLWQISGRNDLPYDERVALDVFYARNWSIWLDLHILMHTFFATLLSRGAY